MTWYEAALVMLSEGMCPEHRLPLAVDGWCKRCGCWWSIQHYSAAGDPAPHVVTEYPDAVTGCRPFPRAG